jgi:hypothetical protein
VGSPASERAFKFFLVTFFVVADESTPFTDNPHGGRLSISEAGRSTPHRRNQALLAAVILKLGEA